MNNKYTLVLLVFVVLQFSCNRTTKEITKANKLEIETETKTKSSPKVKKVEYEDYSNFYDRFHEDSIFQLSRVKFPIKGYFIDTVGNEQKWSKTNWIVHRSKIQEADTSLYKVHIESGKTLNKEELYIEGGGFKVERKFQLINGKWYLVYYSDENL